MFDAVRTLIGRLQGPSGYARSAPPETPAPPREGPALAIYEAAAQQWHDGGRPTPTAKPLDTAVGLWWLGTPKVERLRVNPLVLEHLVAQSTHHKAQNAQWLNAILRMSTWCRYCGEQWHIENVALCTQCDAEFAPCCAPSRLHARWANGNPVCTRCFNGEIVG